MRLIDVDDLGVGRCSKNVLPAAYCAGWNGLLGLVEKAPTVDAVIVTRCKDCKHRIYKNMGDEIGEIGGCGLFNCAMPNEGFCSNGERKDGGADHDA